MQPARKRSVRASVRKPERRFLEQQFGSAAQCPPLLGWRRVRHQQGLQPGRLSRDWFLVALC
jgi:hypothetical protein